MYNVLWFCENLRKYTLLLEAFSDNFVATSNKKLVVFNTSGYYTKVAC